ncbi:hypothetical protein OG390_42550 [Streptomyces sp. NBC_00996]|nr:hypothetical protein OG390_42550 [Streptomyces sp. NBC_00996]
MCTPLFSSPQSCASWALSSPVEAGDSARVVREGYVHVIGDMRGTGDSGGVIRSPHRPTPQVRPVRGAWGGTPIARTERRGNAPHFPEAA